MTQPDFDGIRRRAEDDDRYHDLIPVRDPSPPDLVTRECPDCGDPFMSEEEPGYWVCRYGHTARDDDGADDRYQQAKDEGF